MAPLSDKTTLAPSGGQQKKKAVSAGRPRGRRPCVIGSRGYFSPSAKKHRALREQQEQEMKNYSSAKSCNKNDSDDDDVWKPDNAPTDEEEEEKEPSSLPSKKKAAKAANKKRNKSAADKDDDDNDNNNDDDDDDDESPKKKRKWEPRLAGTRPTNWRQQMDNKVRLRLKGAENNIKLAQVLCTPLTRSDDYNSENTTKNALKLLAKNEAVLPWVNTGMFVYTEQKANEDGNDSAGPFLLKPQIHLMTGSQAALDYLKEHLVFTEDGPEIFFHNTFKDMEDAVLRSESGKCKFPPPKKGRCQPDNTL